jgi:hypothetical protein
LTFAASANIAAVFSANGFISIARELWNTEHPERRRRRKPGAATIVLT